MDKAYKPYEEWFSQSDYDFETAEAMFQTGRYVYCVFMCHLTIEKALKALVVKRLSKVPSKVHNLLYIVDELKLEMPENYVKFVFRLNDVSIPTRYPQELRKLISVYNKANTKLILDTTKELQQWIKEQ